MIKLHYNSSNLKVATMDMEIKRCKLEPSKAYVLTSGHYIKNITNKELLVVILIKRNIFNFINLFIYNFFMKQIN